MHRWVDLVAARSCRGCSAPGTMLCRSCLRDLPPAPDAAPPPGADALLAATSYEGAARSLVLDLKLRALRAAAPPLAEAVASAGRRAGVVGDLVTWVPGRTRQSRTRGFDHAETIARAVADRWGMPAVPLLHRAAETHDQTLLGRADRMANMKGAFAVTDPPAVVGAQVVLIDDLVTTGATASACSSALRGAGAASVEVAVPCRAG